MNRHVPVLIELSTGIGLAFDLTEEAGRQTGGKKSVRLPAQVRTLCQGNLMREIYLQLIVSTLRIIC